LKRHAGAVTNCGRIGLPASQADWSLPRLEAIRDVSEYMKF